MTLKLNNTLYRYLKNFIINNDLNFTSEVDAFNKMNIPLNIPVSNEEAEAILDVLSAPQLPLVKDVLAKGLEAQNQKLKEK